jgi:hypothetical protein
MRESRFIDTCSPFPEYAPDILKAVLPRSEKHFGLI